MKQISLSFALLVTSLVFLLLPNKSVASVIEVGVGNTTSGLVDGTVYNFFPDIFDVQNGQPGPFNGAHGHEILGDPSLISWNFNFAAFSDNVDSATLSFGIWDHDTAASGSQLDLFNIGGFNHTGELDTLFETTSANDGQYNEYTLTLDASVFSLLQAGSLDVFLDIGGFGLQTQVLNGGLVSETEFNAFHLISSTLSIQTSAPGGSNGGGSTPVPEPSTLILFVCALIGLRKTLHNG